MFWQLAGLEPPGVAVQLNLPFFGDKKALKGKKKLSLSCDSENFPDVILS